MKQLASGVSNQKHIEISSNGMYNSNSLWSTLDNKQTDYL